MTLATGFFPAEADPAGVDSWRQLADHTPHSWAARPFEGERARLFEVDYTELLRVTQLGSGRAGIRI